MMGVAIIRGKGIPTKIIVQFIGESNLVFMERIVSFCGLTLDIESRNTITIEWVWDK